MDEQTDKYELHILNRETAVFDNKECEKSGTCSLNQADFTVENYRIKILEEPNPEKTAGYGTRMFARYRTDSPATLEEYVFVQFIRGCVYETSLVNGKVVVTYQVARHHFNPNLSVTFKHPEWAVDTDNPDPAYSSMPKTASYLACGTDTASPFCDISQREARYFFLRWNTEPGSTDRKTEQLYGEKRPEIPEAYVADHPAQAFFYNSNYRTPDSARNVSLQFRICLYKARDVPLQMSPADPVDLPNPITCFEWDSSFIYDWVTGKLEHRNEIVQECK